MWQKQVLMINKREFLNLVSQINFNNMQPDLSIDVNKHNRNKISWDSTNIPNKKELSSLSKIDGMSTAANCFLINSICKSFNKDELYLNVGVWKGLSLCSGLLNTECRVIGIDDFSQFGGPKETLLKNYENYKRGNDNFYDIDYIDYFKNHKGNIDFYFYDGEHSYENQYKAITLAAPFLQKNSLILIDDTNCDDPRNATFKALDDLNFKYDIWFDQKTAHNCHPTYWNGLILCQII